MDANIKFNPVAVHYLVPGERVISLIQGNIYAGGAKVGEFPPGMTGTVFKSGIGSGTGEAVAVRWDAGYMAVVYDGEVALISEVVAFAAAHLAARGQ